MSANTDLLLSLVVGVPVAVGAYVAFLLGPLGWFAIGYLAIGVMVVRSLLEDPQDRTPARQNCSSCGSPNPVDAGACDYCGGDL